MLFKLKKKKKGEGTGCISRFYRPVWLGHIGSSRITISFEDPKCFVFSSECQGNSISFIQWRKQSGSHQRWWVNSSAQHPAGHTVEPGAIYEIIDFFSAVNMLRTAGHRVTDAAGECRTTTKWLFCIEPRLDGRVCSAIGLQDPLPLSGLSTLVVSGFCAVPPRNECASAAPRHSTDVLYS